MLVGQNDGLTGREFRLPGQAEVVPQQLPQGYAVRLGDGGEGVSLSHGIGLCGELDHQGLPHR